MFTLSEELKKKLGVTSTEELGSKDMGELFGMRKEHTSQEAQNALGAAEHRAYMREEVQENPWKAIPFATFIPVYNALKAVDVVKGRSQPSIHAMEEAYKGIIEGLAQSSLGKGATKGAEMFSSASKPVDVAEVAGKAVGDKVLNVTGSPAAATAADIATSMFADPSNLVPGKALAGVGAAGIFAGAKGMKRLEAEGVLDASKTFESKYHGTRNEINPPKWALGAFSMDAIPVAANKLFEGAKEGINIVRGKVTDLLPKELFPDLYKAYPEVEKLPINVIKTDKDQPLQASYRVADPIGVTPAKDTLARSLKITDRRMREWERKNPEPDYRKDKEAWEAWAKDKYKTMFDSSKQIKAIHDQPYKKDPGEITLYLPNTKQGMSPGLSFAESLLHEVQHYIQGIEEGGRRVLKEKYETQDKALKQKLTDSLYSGKATGRGYRERKYSGSSPKVSDNFIYKSNTYERETHDSAARDIMHPDKRAVTPRVTEKKKK